MKSLFRPFLVLAAALPFMLAACGDKEPEQRAAFTQFLQTRIVDKPGVRVPKLVTLPSPYRLVVHPIVDYVLKVEKENPGRTIAVVIASMVERHWFHYFLHNQRGQMLTALLLLGGDERITIINVPWYLKA